MYEMTDLVCQILPASKPRYLMGVGTPVNILECIALGIDMFDCVLPTRNARHGLLYTANGIINIKNLKWKTDFSPIDETSPCTSSRFYTKSYLRHLLHSQEILGAQISTLHNLSFFHWLVCEPRKNIAQGVFREGKNILVPSLSKML